MRISVFRDRERPQYAVERGNPKRQRGTNCRKGTNCEQPKANLNAFLTYVSGFQPSQMRNFKTRTLPLNQLKRTKAEDSVSLDGQLVAIKLVFNSPEHNPGLTIDRLWVTRAQPAEPRSPMGVYEDRMDALYD